MPRLSSTLDAYYIAGGVRSDFQKLLQKFVNTNTVRYEQFAEIWREMRMSDILAGRPDIRALREFVEEVLKIAVTFWMPPNDFQTRAGALYILYAIYFKQGLVPPACICLTLAQWQTVQSFMKEVKAQQHLDIEYVFYKLRTHCAFHFTATNTPMSLEEYIGSRSSAPNDADDSDAPVLEDADLLSNILDPDNISQLSAIHDQYHRMKCALAGSDQPSVSLNVIQDNLVQYITKSVAAHDESFRRNKGAKRRRHESGATTTSESEAESENDPDWVGSPTKQKKSILQTRSEIRKRAFQSGGKGSGLHHQRSRLESDSDREGGHSWIMSGDEANLNMNSTLESDIDKVMEELQRNQPRKHKRRGGKKGNLSAGSGMSDEDLDSSVEVTAFAGDSGSKNKRPTKRGRKSKQVQDTTNDAVATTAAKKKKQKKVKKNLEASVDDVPVKEDTLKSEGLGTDEGADTTEDNMHESVAISKKKPRKKQKKDLNVSATDDGITETVAPSEECLVATDTAAVDDASDSLSTRQKRQRGGRRQSAGKIKKTDSDGSPQSPRGRGRGRGRRSVPDDCDVSSPSTPGRGSKSKKNRGSKNVSRTDHDTVNISASDVKIKTSPAATRGRGRPRGRGTPRGRGRGGKK